MNIQVKSILSLLCIVCGSLNAQDIFKGKIKGKVIDNVTKQALPGVTVLLRGTSLGTITDTTGIFELTAIEEGIHSIQVSYIGYQEKIIQDVRVIRNKTSYLEIEVAELQLTLDEVTVNAY